jgi:large subunit ribosomal protein L17
MRHRKKSEKFSRPRAQRKALVKSLLRALLIYESIKTTESKAKGLRPWVDRLIEWGKVDTLHSRRLAYRLLGDHNLVKRLFENIAPRFKEIKGGYSRVISLTSRRGDGAKISILELTKKERREKPKKEKRKKKEVAPKEEEKKEEIPLKKQPKPKRSFIRGIRGIFKKERDAL